MPKMLTPEEVLLFRKDPTAGKLKREFLLERAAIDEAERTVPVSFSSELPVRRYMGGREIMEILDHEDVDLSRMNDGAPVLFNHNIDMHLGVVKVAAITSEKKGRALVKFSRSKAADEKFQDVKDGILTKSSVGYSLENAECVQDGEQDGVPVFRFRKWQPYEVTLTPLPADNTVGVNRSQTAETKPTTHMAETATATAAPALTNPAPAVTINEKDVRNAELNRVREIYSIAARFKIPDERRDKAVNDAESLESFKDWTLREHIKAEPVQVSPDIGMSGKEKKRYRLTRALSDLANMRPLSGLEKECSDATAQRLKINPQGFLIPHDLASFDDPELTRAMIQMSPTMRANMRTMSASTFGVGGATVQTDVLGGSLIELLRNRMYLTRLGVKNLSGLVGNIAIPRHSGPATAYWLAEGDSVTASSQAISQLGLTPKKLAAQTGFTKQLLAQSSIDVEAFIREDLMEVLAIAKDLAGIQGTGGKQPLGIVNTPNIGSMTFTAAATWSNVVSFETTVAAANADVPSMNWLTTPTTRGKWKTAVKVANYPVFICEGNQVNGYPLWATNQITGVANQVIFGNFADAIYGDWAGWDVVVDPYTQAASGQIIITLTIWTDFGVRHPASFCVSTDSGAQ